MAEITGQEPIEDAAVLLQTSINERFKIDGFKGLRRVEINRFAKPFFITAENTTGTIESFPDDMKKETLDTMMSMYLAQGKFGSDPFNLRPQDKMDDLQKQIEELKAAWQGPQANPVNDQFERTTTHVDVPEVVEPIETPIVFSGDGKRAYVLNEDLTWDELRTRAKDMGIETFHKKRPTITAEIEAKEAE